MSKDFMRFLIVGIINTLSTYLIYLFLLIVFNYHISYTISYIAGIIISYYLNSIYVFKEKVSFIKFLKYPIVYVVQYLINLATMFLFIEYLHFQQQIVPIIVMVLSIPITYLLSKLIIKSRTVIK